MSSIKKEKVPLTIVEKVSDYLSALAVGIEPHLRQIAAHLGGAKGSEPEGHPNRIWFRGQDEYDHEATPGVYREAFIKASLRVKPAPGGGPDWEAKVLTLERLMLRDFRLAAASLVDPNDLSNLNVLARHHGLPTRLLDWSTNPLAALYFATEEAKGKDGAVLILGYPIRLLRETRGGENLGLMTIRDPVARASFKLSGWHSYGELKGELHNLILPIIPDAIHPRLSQQSSRFTLHVHQSPDFREVPWVRIPAKKKGQLRAELQRCGIDRFTVYGDLDSLCKHLNELWCPAHS